MLTAILISCMFLILIEIWGCVSCHLIHADTPYEFIIGLVWIGWFITVFVFCIKLAVSVNKMEVVLQW